MLAWTARKGSIWVLRGKARAERNRLVFAGLRSSRDLEYHLPELRRMLTHVNTPSLP
jgi:hypothetical protein